MKVPIPMNDPRIQLNRFHDSLQSQLHSLEQTSDEVVPWYLQPFHQFGKFFSGEIGEQEDRFEAQTDLIRFSFSKAQLAWQTGKFERSHRWLEKAKIQLTVASRIHNRELQAAAGFAEEHTEPVIWGLGVGGTLAVAAIPLGIGLVCAIGVSGSAHAVAIHSLTHDFAEPAILQTVQSNQEPYTLRSLPEVNLEAEAALQLWKKNPQADFAMGRFLLESALATERGPQAKTKFSWQSRQWDRFVQDLQKSVVNRKEEAYQVAAAKTVKAFLTKGDETLGRLTDALNGFGANCDTQGQAILAAFLDGKIFIPSPYVLGIQVYRGHSQPVLFDPGAETAINLVTGKPPERMGAIYHPYLLLHAYLKGQGIVPPVSEEDLLIWKPWNLDWRRWSDKGSPSPLPLTNSLMSYPKSDLEANHGPHLRKVDIPVPFEDKLPKQEVSDDTDGSDTKTKVRGIWIESLGLKNKTAPQPATDEWESHLKNLFEEQDVLDFMFLNSEIYFRHAWEAIEFNQLPPAGKKDFIYHLGKDAMKAFLQKDSDLEPLNSFLNSPEDFLQKRPGDLSRINGLSNLFSLIFSSTRGAYDALDTNQAAPFLFADSTARTEVPKLEQLPPKINSFRSWTVEHPRKVFEAMSLLEEKDREAFLALLAIFLQYPLDEDPLVKFAQQDHALELSDAPKPKPSSQAVTKPSTTAPSAQVNETEIIEIDLIDSELMRLPSEAPSPPKQPSDVLYLSTNAMLNFLVDYVFPRQKNNLVRNPPAIPALSQVSWMKLLRFWTPAMSEAYLQKYSGGEPDLRIVNNWLNIRQSRLLPTPLAGIPALEFVSDSPQQLPPDLAKLRQVILDRDKIDLKDFVENLVSTEGP